MGAKLEKIVKSIREQTTGLPAIDLARLNLRVGKALSREAALIPDDPAIVALAQRIADEIMRENEESR